MKIYYFDFDDSFSWNIIKAFETVCIENQTIELIHWTAIPQWKNKIIDSKESLLLVFGPGPKRPSDYPEMMDFIKQLMITKIHFLIGICLGHQAILEVLGHQLTYAKRPLHGIQEKLFLNKYWREKFKIKKNVILVQRYNSLAISDQKDFAKKVCNQDKEIFIYHQANCLTFQFHPESVGTEFRDQLFQSILEFYSQYRQK